MKVYPELSHYLFEDRRFVDTLAQRMNVHVNDVWAQLKQLREETRMLCALIEDMQMHANNLRK